MSIYIIQQIYWTYIVIIFINFHQELTFGRMSTLQYNDTKVMTFHTESHEIRLVGRKINVMTLM